MVGLDVPKGLFQTKQLSDSVISDHCWPMKGSEQKSAHGPLSQQKDVLQQLLTMILQWSSDTALSLQRPGNKSHSQSTSDRATTPGCLKREITSVPKNPHPGQLGRVLGCRMPATCVTSATAVCQAALLNSLLQGSPWQWQPQPQQALPEQKSQAPTCFARSAISLQLHTSGTGTAVEGVPGRQQAQMGAASIVVLTGSVNFKRPEMQIYTLLEPLKLPLLPKK